MKLLILAVGKPREKRLAALAEDYLVRLRGRGPFPGEGMVGVERVPDSSAEQEGQGLLSRVHPRDRLILLSEDGEEQTSRAFAAFLAGEMAEAAGRLIFVIGGPWGVSDAVKGRADRKIALSRMTFTHEMCFLFLAEQLYRAFSILRGSGYHH